MILLSQTEDEKENFCLEYIFLGQVLEVMLKWKQL